MTREMYVEHSDTGRNTDARTIAIGPHLTLVFSYKTVVAFAISGYGWVVSENIWGPTTGRHINELVPGASRQERIPREKFEQMLEVALAGLTFDRDATVGHMKVLDGTATVFDVDRYLGGAA